MQEGNENERVKTLLEDPEDDRAYIYQGARPKEKFCNNTNKYGEGSNNITNGSTSQRKTKKKKKKKIGRVLQNGASLSSLSSSTSSSPESSMNEVLSSGSSNSVKSKILLKASDERLNENMKKLGHLVNNENLSGNEGDDGLSGDDFCIYTYKGDQFADLPNSLFPAEIVEHDGDEHHRENHYEANQRRGNQQQDEERSNPGSSPEMDYLEMDFDPGPSLEQDSEDEIENFEKKTSNDSSVPELPSEHVENSVQEAGVVQKNVNCGSQESKPGPSNETLCLSKNNNSKTVTSNSNTCCTKSKENVSGSRGAQYSIDESSDNYDVGSDERQEFDKEERNCGSCNNHSYGGRRLDNKNLWTDDRELSNVQKSVTEADLKRPFDGIMLWTEPEAISNQVTLASSEVSCGATAVINVMLALKMRFSIEKVKEGICTRLRSDSSSIPQYLVSRSFAGVAHENLIRGIHHASQGVLYAKFFQMYPRRDIALSRWLSRWMKMGAVPIATMNVQRDIKGSTSPIGATASESSASDSRHHQMIYGVNSKGIHLMNPMECLRDEELWCRLTSPSVLNVKRQEIVSRWSPDTNLKPLMFQSDDRWKTMNVLGQVVNIIRESPDPSAQGKFLTQHISIPASSGITLVIPRDSHGYEELLATTDLPLSSSMPELK
ncbi:hypothetical protein RUM44_011594 [Polyplax serrata]|uniref:Uncharacterized protein n=1 Tax=Polyplax serrata TaxID=468196 RepID=A0ABR1AQS5_POLSC